MSQIEIGRLLRAGTAGFVVGCRVSQIDAPSFGALIRVPLERQGDFQVYGMIHDIHIDDDGLVRQLVTAEGVDTTIIEDNRSVQRLVKIIFWGSNIVVKFIRDRSPMSMDHTQRSITTLNIRDKDSHTSHIKNHIKRYTFTIHFLIN